MEKGYNITGNETCDDPQIMKRTCEFPILWWASIICRADANVLLLSPLGVSRGGYALTVAHLHPPTRQILPFDTWCKAFPPTPSLQRNNSQRPLDPDVGHPFAIPIDPNINLRIMRNQGAWVIMVPGQGLLNMQFTNWQRFSNVKQPLAGGTLQCWRDVISTNTITISPSSLQLTLKHLDISCLAILRGRVISPNNILNGPETGGRDLC